MFAVCHKVHKLAKTEKKIILAIFRNYSLLKGSKLIILPQWSDKGAHSIQDIMGLQGLREFHDLQKSLQPTGHLSLFICNDDNNEQ